MKLPSKTRALRAISSSRARGRASTFHAWLLVTVLSGLGACTTDPSDQTVVDDDDSAEGLGAQAHTANADPVDLAQAAATLKQVGFADPQLEQVGSQIIINGDMAVETATLETWQSAAHNKGYYHPGLAAPSVTDVCVQLVPGWLAGPEGAEMPFEWAWAFLVAAAEWNDRTDVNMRWAALGDLTCNQVIQLNYVRLYKSDGTLNLAAYAQGLLPTGNGKPGKTLSLNRAFSGNNCNGGNGNINSVPWAEKVRVALHEIGHTLGFRHPQDNYVAFPLLPPTPPTHIAGTQAVAGTTWEETFSYPSVMHTALCIGGHSGAGVGALSADDISSANRKFP